MEDKKTSNEDKEFDFITKCADNVKKNINEKYAKAITKDEQLKLLQNINDSAVDLALAMGMKVNYVKKDSNDGGAN